MSAVDHLDDADLLFDRSKYLHGQFAAMTGIGPNLLWDLRRTARANGASHSAEIVINRAVHRRLKPVIADIANNLVHTLDHVTAAARVHANTGKKGRCYFPIAADDGRYAERDAETRQYIGDGWADLFAGARERHRPYLTYLSTLKSISNEAKHWELRAGTAGAHAVQWFAPHHRIEQIPSDHFVGNDAFRFWEDPEPFPNVAVQIVTSYRIRGEDIGDVPLDSMVSTTSIFVAGLIAAARDRLASS